MSGGSPGWAKSQPGGSLGRPCWRSGTCWRRAASDDFAGSAVAAAVVAPPDGRGPAAHAALVRHRQATRGLLEDLARSAGPATWPSSPPSS